MLTIAKNPNMKATVAALIAVFISSVTHAGAWGEGSFENDDALDWVGECVSAPGISPVSKALDSVLRSDYIEAPDGSAAIAAVEVVAAALGKPGAKLPSELRDWVSRQSQTELAQLAPEARKALIRIQDPKLSELQQLWADVQDGKWQAAVAELSARLNK